MSVLIIHPKARQIRKAFLFKCSWSPLKDQLPVHLCMSSIVTFACPVAVHGSLFLTTCTSAQRGPQTCPVILKIILADQNMDPRVIGRPCWGMNRSTRGASEGTK